MNLRTPIASAALVLLALSGAAEGEERAAELYYRGLDEVEATLPSSSLTMPSTMMRCLNCHGADGLGGREGGVDVPPITWRRLSMATANRPAYDATSLARALRDGLGPDGRSLHAIMPRYALPDDMIDGVADWLRVIAPGQTPGVTGDEIVIAVPPAKVDDPRAAIVSTVLHYYADDLNWKGGIYGRKLRLIEVGDGGEKAFARLAALEPRPSADDALLDLWPLDVGAEGVPQFPLTPPDDWLLQHLLDLARLDDPSARRLSHFGDDDELPKAVVFDGEAEALSAFVEGWFGPTSLTIYTTPRHVDLARLQGLTSRPLRIVLPNLFASGEGAHAEIESAAFEAAAERLQLPEVTEPIARAAWVAALLLEQALRTTGRRLDRYRFDQAVQSMPILKTGLLPPVDPTRGLTTLALVSFDVATGKVTRGQHSLR